MAEQQQGFELYHVPQQSRRDKLRVNVQDFQGCPGLLPFYDPLTSSHLIPHDLLAACATTNHHRVKEEGGMNLLSYVHHHNGHANNNNNGSSSSSSSFLDPNPHHNNNNNNPFLYSPQNLRLLDHHHHQQQFTTAGEMIVHKPEPLALSLSSSHNTHQSNPPLELNLHRSSVYGGGGGGGGEFRSSVPLGPFTGYTSILKGSRFLKPAQELLEELCEVGCGINYGEKISTCGGSDGGLLMDPPPLESCGLCNDDDPNNCGGGGDRGKKSRLISMLDEVHL